MGIRWGETGLILSNELMLDRRSSKYSLSLYQEIYIHNRLEELNKQKYIFLIAIKRGFALEIEERETKNNNASVTDSVITSDCEDESVSDQGSSITNSSHGVINEHIGNAEDIDFIEFNKLKKLQKQCNLTREDHYKLTKHFTKMNTGLDFIDS